MPFIQKRSVWRIAICSGLASLELCIFVLFRLFDYFLFRVIFSYSEEYTWNTERLYHFHTGKINQMFLFWRKDILNHSVTKQSLSKSICLVLPIQVLVHTNLLYNILSRVLAGPQKLKHYVSGTESMLPNIHMLRSTRNVSHGFPTTTTFGELSLPLYS